jgi:predicted oxidoreductase
MPAGATLVDATPRPLGPHQVGALALGCWRMTGSPADAQALVEAALDAGCNLVDTADVYGLDWGGSGFGSCEEVLGQVLAVAPHLRQRTVLATKGGIRPGVPYDSSAASLTAACEASLRRLGTDHVELYQVHRPDLFTHPHHLADTLQRLVDRGLVEMVGVSNYSVSQTTALRDALSVPLVSTQPELSATAPHALRDGTLDLAMADGRTVLAWSPLAGGRLLSGQGVRPELLAVLDAIAEREDVNRATVCYAFVLAHPSRPVPILGTQQPARIHQAWAATRVHLDRTDVYALVEAADGVPLP